MRSRLRLTGDARAWVSARHPVITRMSVDMHLAGSEVATVSLGGDRLLVGRERELGELRAGLDEALVGRGALIVLMGEPGIGKTLLTEALAAEAARSGAHAVWGRCWAGGGAPAYWPWMQILGRVDCGAAVVLEEGTGEGIAPAQPGSARVAVFRCVVDRIAAAGAQRPLLLALDDLQAADAPSLLLLRFIARQLAELPVLVVGTCPEAGGAAGQGGTPLLEALTDGRRLPLRGLGEADVACMVEHRTGQRASLAVVRRVHRLTEGNPLFVDEIVRLWAAEVAAGAGAAGSAAVRVPRTVREAIRHRLEGLPAVAVDALAIAAVAGREFDAVLLSDLGGPPAQALTTALDAALGAGVLEGVGGDRYRFAHGLMREVVYERLTPNRRAELHVNLARRIESEPEVAARVSELAHHYRRAVPAVEVALAVEWSLRAARQALDVLAYEDSAAHAMGALELQAGGSERVELLLVLGDAQMATGEMDAARAAFARAAQTARELQAPQLLARAALGFGSGRAAWAKRGVDTELVNLLQEARAALCDSGLRAALLARLAEELLHLGNSERPDELSRDAVALARGGADDVALTRALGARLLATLRSGSLIHRGGLIAELRASAERSEDIEALHSAYLWQVNEGLERGDRAAVEEARERLGELVGRTRQPHQLWSAEIIEGMLALLDGRLSDAERHVEAALSAAEGVVPLAAQMHGIQLMALRREQGRLVELEPVAREAAASHPAALPWRCAWIGLLCETGREAEARRELARLPDDAFEVAAMSLAWVAVAMQLAEICARLGESTRAGELYAALAPYAGEVAVVSFSVLCWGASDRYLGLLAGALGRWEDAERHFDTAQVLHAGLASALWTARTEADRAAVRMASGDDAGARAAAQVALALAEDRGLVAIADRARAVLARPLARSPVAKRATPAPEVLLFRREGQLWTIGDPAAPVRLPDYRGLSYVAALLDRPGEEHLAAELAGALSAREEPVLDPAARAAFAARLDQLRIDAEDAERFGDGERAALAHAELDVLAAELGRAVGLRGRDRRLPGPAERARSSVTKAIRAAIRRIATQEPALAEHLNNSIRTGTFCSYRRDTRHPVTWQVTL